MNKESSNNREITDLVYKKMSQEAYKDYETGKKIGVLPGWEVLDQKHNSSGMDVVTFYNPDTKQAVIAFRGTEGSSTWDRKAPDLKADVLNIGLPEAGATIARIIDPLSEVGKENVQGIEDTLGITWLNNLFGDTGKSIDKEFGPDNQLYEAEDYVKEMQSKYPDADFTLTGHSLGGANAQYAAVYTGLDAVTFSAPTVVASLTPEMRRKAEEGAFDRQVTNFIHPGDFIASGMLGGYERHVGSTLVIDKNYDDFNASYGAVDKIKDTLGGPSYHDMKHYSFDDDGYIDNTLYDEITGERVSFSPRKPSDHNILDHAREAWDTLSKGFKSVVNVVGGYSSGTIELTPEELKEIAGKWSRQAQDMSRTFERIQRNFFEYTESSHSQRLVPIVWDLQMSIKQLDEWHLEHTTDLVDYIQNKADLFIQADSGTVA
ncbi:lipase family protein [Paenibacillus xylanexedens]|uniref:lipase family protein n=1 Tax=Paenibacillus xylanexedens TaxID=528191 RepID=UPI003D076BBB